MTPDRTHIRRMRSVCNHHSKILQHHRIITRLDTRSHTHDVCDPLVIITPRFYNILASSPDRTHTHTHMRRMRSACNHHSKILQHHRIIASSHHRIITESRTHTHTHTYDACDPLVIITPRFYNIIASSHHHRIAHTHIHTHTMHAIRL